MAALFSIREYAVNMRRIDVGKCWPFDAEENPKDCPLPPMPMRKFRLWSDELKAEAEPDGCRGEETDPTVKSASCSRAGKHRTPKKRSIVEIFAVAPPIEAVEVVDVEQEDRKKLVKRKKRKKKLISKKTVMKKKKKKKKQQLRIEICAKRKEKIHKPKPSVDTFHTIEDLVHKTSSGKNIENSSSSWKKTSCMKNLPRKHKFKLLQNSKVISKSRKKVGKVIPVHSILKNSSRGAIKKTNKKPKTKGDSTTKPCQSPKHVSFSGKDDIIGHNENCPNINLPQFHSLCKIFSRVLAASSDLENSREVDSLLVPTDVHVGNLSSKNVTSSSEGIIGSLLEKEQSSVSSGRDIPMYMGSDNERCSTAERSSLPLHVDLNHSVQTYSDLDRISPGASEVPSDSHIGDRRILNSSYSEGSSSHSVIHLEETLPMPSDACHVPTSPGMLLSMSNTTDLQAIVKSPRQYHSTSSIEQNEKQLQPPVWPTFDSCFHNLDYQPKHHLPSKDLIGSMSSSVVSRLTSQPVPTCKQKHVADYIGLPLNSQGELIHLHSGAKFGIGEVFKQQNAVQSSIHSLRVPNSTESRITIGDAEAMKGKFYGAAISGLQDEYYHVSKPETSGFSFTRGSERRELQNYEPLNSNGRLFYHGVNPKQVSYHEHREDDSTHNYIDMVKFQVERHLNRVPQPAVQQTMRLMGKNVTVGQNSKEHHAHDDGRIWTDKEVITDNRHSVRVSNIPLPNHWSRQEWVAPRPTFGTSKDNLCWALETPTNLSQNPGMETTVGLVHTDYQPQRISNNGVFSRTEDASFKVDLFSHRRPSQLLNKTSNSTVFSKLGATSVNMGYQMAMTSNPPPTTCQNMLSSSTNWKHSKDIAYSTSSTLNIPFPCCNNQRFSQPSQMYSAQNLSECLLTPKQQKLNPETLGSSHPNTFSSCQPYGLSSSNLFTPPSSSMIPFSVYSTNNSQRCLSTNPALVQPSSVPLPTTNKSNSVVKDYRRNSKGRERGQLNFTYLKSSDKAGKTRKRPAAEDDVFMRPAKKPLSRMREDINASAGLKEGDQMHRYTQNKEKGTGISTHEMVNATEGFKFSSASSSLKLDGNSRSGPIKLSAGARHILKPSQAIGPEEARPTHSTLPLSFGDTSCRTLDSQKKPAEVYRF